MERRAFLGEAAAGTAIVALGGAYALLDDEVTRAARAQRLPDGRPRLPDGQRVITRLKNMGGRAGNARIGEARLRIHGEVRRELDLSIADLLAMRQTEASSDVHCVTGWSVLDAAWTGVRVADLAELVGVTSSARHVIFEGAWGYTANVPLDEATAPEVLVAYRHEGRPLARANGAPLRAVVPALYFWKSAKWLQGIRFSAEDHPGYWELRGYHNRGDPWLEQRYA